MAIGALFIGYFTLVIAGLMGASWVPHVGVPRLGGIDRSGANTRELRGAPLVPVVSTPTTSAPSATVAPAPSRGNPPTTITLPTTSAPGPPTSTPGSGKGNGPPSSPPGQSKRP
jgi:hypothetical protein